MSRELFDQLNRKEFKRKVNRIVDGDTFIISIPIEGVNRIRIHGVDTPEIGTGTAAVKATEFLRKLILARTVTLKIVGYNPKKGYYPARWVCEVHVGFLRTKNVSDAVLMNMSKKRWWFW